MNIATALSLVAAALDLFIGALTLGLARAPGWRHYRVFAVISLSAAAYSVVNAFFSHTQTLPALVPPLARLNGLIAAVNAAAWIFFARHQADQTLGTTDRVLVAGLTLLGAASLVPNLVFGSEVISQEVHWAALSYQVTTITPLGEIGFTFSVLCYCWTAWQYVKQIRNGHQRAWHQMPGFLMFLATAVNEALVSAGRYPGLYLADVGLLAVLLGVSVDVVSRVVEDADQLRKFTSHLSREVENRDKALTSAKQQLVHSDRLAALGRLSASIGHEINNPLTYVIGNIDYAREEVQQLGSTPTVTDALDEAREGVERIRTIVRELRAFSRSSDHEPDAVLQVEDLLEGAIRLTAAHLRHTAQLDKQIQPDLLVFGSATRLTQVFVNVLTNAAQAILPEHAGTTAAKIWLRASAVEGGRVRIQIEDTGTGINESDREQLFEPFFTTKPIDKGTGLGLFVSLGIIAAAGGHLDIRNRDRGSGSLVTVDLPAARRVTAAPAPELVPHAVTTSLRILIVDDDPLVAKTLARLLRRHQVDTVTSGAAAWKYLEREGSAVGLIICDLMMPEISGIDLYETVLKHNPELADRFLFTSGGATSEQAQSFITANGDRFLPKPVDNKLLNQLVAEHALLMAGASAQCQLIPSTTTPLA